MPTPTARSKHAERSIRYVILLLVVIFASEFAEMHLFGGLMSHLSPLAGAVGDGLILSTVFALPLWIVCRQVSQDPDDPVARRSLAAALLKVLGTVFLFELLITLALPWLMPNADLASRNLADASLATVLSILPLWWLFFVRKSEPRRIPLSVLLGIPLRLYALLLLLIFLADLIQSLLLSGAHTGPPSSFDRVADAFLTTMLIAPVLWLFVIRPLNRVADSDRFRASAIHNQVNDAIVAVTPQGTVASFNPAAELIFGYRSQLIVGQPAALLFKDGRQGLEFLIDPDDACAYCRQVTGLREDGRTMALEVSVSRMQWDASGYLLIMRDITERKEAERVLLATLSLQNATLESTADGILAVDRGNRVQSFNQKFLQMWGIPGELAETGDRDTMIAGVLAQLRDPEALRGQIDEQSRHPELPATASVLLKDGRIFECYCYPQLLEERVVGRVWSFRDISAKNKAEETLRQSEEFLRQVFDQSEDAILFFQFGGCRILDLNHKAERVFGYQRHELLELGLEVLCEGEDFTILCSSITSISEQRGAKLDNISCRRRDGREIIVTMRGKLLTLQGSQVAYCTFRDVTERLRMEQEARDIQSKLIQANKMTSLGLLVSGVAHEINNPNNYILANARLLHGAWQDALKFLRGYYQENGEFLLGGIPFSQLDRHAGELFEGIMDGSGRIESIITSLKGFARQERTGTDREVDLNKVATSAANLLHHELVKFTSNFHLDLAEELPKVQGNGQQLGQVIINLLTNACQALPDRSRGIWLETGYDPATAQVTITVRDEGEGISREDGSRILEPFFTTKLDNGGTGLGLSISHSIVKDHAGTLEFSSEPGKGTIFQVKLPARGVPSAGG